MLFEFIAAISAAFVGAGFALLLRAISGGRAPRIVIPIFAGLGMLTFTIWREYSWFDDTVAALPPEIVVVQSYEDPSPFRPWTYAFPFANRFMAVDTGHVLTDSGTPDVSLTQAHVYNRWGPTQSLPVVFNCAEQDAVIADAASRAGRVGDLSLRHIPERDLLVEALCDRTPGAPNHPGESAS